MWSVLSTNQRFETYAVTTIHQNRMLRVVCKCLLCVGPLSPVPSVSVNYSNFSLELISSVSSLISRAVASYSIREGNVAAHK